MVSLETVEGRLAASSPFVAWRDGEATCLGTRKTGRKISCSLHQVAVTSFIDGGPLAIRSRRGEAQQNVR